MEKNPDILTLVEKKKRTLPGLLFNRLTLVVVLLLLQVLVLLGLFLWFDRWLPSLYGASTIFSLLVILYLLNGRMDPTGKITWLVVIMLLPVFGGLLYLFTERDIGHRAMGRLMQKRSDESQLAIPQNPETMEKLRAECPGAAAMARYIHRSGCFPVYENTNLTYFPLGEDKFRQLLLELQKAEKFIFLEYFILAEGLMWGSVLKILAEKAAQGVEVRVMYDGTNEFTNLPHDYPRRLEKLGIRCKMFAPASLMVSTHYNYRDHRKILVIDGHTAFTGGINLADEYINHKVLHGHWKDTALMLKGEAVQSFTLMFLQMWCLDEKQADYQRYLNQPIPPAPPAPGFVIPYGDCPLDRDKVGRQVYMDILNRAERYVYIMTPYLILDGDMENALIYAGERGVDVRIILPGIPDKISPYALAYTHYRRLLDAGVKVYQYTPGFVHAKVFLSDDREAVVGTINLDYRSLYHHFECAAYLYGTACLPDIARDFGETLQKCQRVTRESMKQEPMIRKVMGPLLKAFAPLL